MTRGQGGILPLDDTCLNDDLSQNLAALLSRVTRPLQNLYRRANEESKAAEPEPAAPTGDNADGQTAAQETATDVQMGEASTAVEGAETSAAPQGESTIPSAMLRTEIETVRDQAATENIGRGIHPGTTPLILDLPRDLSVSAEHHDCSNVACPRAMAGSLGG